MTKENKFTDIISVTTYMVNEIREWDELNKVVNNMLDYIEKSGDKHMMDQAIWLLHYNVRRGWEIHDKYVKAEFNKIKEISDVLDDMKSNILNTWKRWFNKPQNLPSL